MAIVNPVTGTSAALGQFQENGEKLAVGNLKSDGVVDIKLTTVDAGTSPTDAVNAVRRGLSAKPAVMTGPIFGTQMLAVEPIIAKASVPMLTTSGSVAVTQQGNKWIFRYFPNDSITKTATVNFAAKTLGARTGSVLYGSDQYGLSGLSSIKQALKDQSVPLVSSAQVNNSDTDMTAQVRQILSKDPGVVFVQISDTSAIAVAVKALRATGTNVPIIFNSGLTSPAATNLLPADQLKGLYAETAGLVAGSADPKVQSFAKSYSAAFNNEPDIFAALAYDEIEMVGHLVAEASGDTGPAEICKRLAAMDYQGLIAKYHSDSEGNMNHTSIVVQFGANKAQQKVGSFTAPFTPRTSC